MNRLLALAVLILTLGSITHAQEETPASVPNEDDAKFVFNSAFKTPVGEPQVASRSPRAFAAPAPSLTFAEPAPPSPEPRFVFGGRDDFRYQLGIGPALVRFRSNVYYATAIGTSTSLTYFTNEWFGVEAKFITAFAPTIYLREHVKYFSYGIGPRVAWRRARFEPWVHGTVGGGHIHPQTALGGQNAFDLQAGAGIDYRLNPRLSVRTEVDWIRSHFFGQWQDSGQALLEAVLHF
jgi:hypothetical protein